MESLEISKGKVDSSFWKGKKVYLTGHTGFKGYWLCNILNYLGARVYGISDRFIFSENQQSAAPYHLKNSRHNAVVKIDPDLSVAWHQSVPGPTRVLQTNPTILRLLDFLTEFLTTSAKVYFYHSVLSLRPLLSPNDMKCVVLWYLSFAIEGYS